MIDGVVCGHCDYGYTCNTAQFCVEIPGNDVDYWTEEPEEDLVEIEVVDIDVSVLVEEDEIFVDDNEIADEDILLVKCIEGQTSSTVCGLNGNGLQKQICTGGHWIKTGRCDDPDICLNGTDGYPGTNDPMLACGLNGRGHLVHDCVLGQWVLRQPEECNDPDDCVDHKCEMGVLGFSVCCQNGHIVYTETFCLPPDFGGCPFASGCC